MASSSYGAYGPAASSQAAGEPMQRSSSGDRPKKPQSRQLLSCTMCRERKVKCDRTKPCTACCARGHPKECRFVVGEGNDYSPIQQSYEIRKLRTENQRLKERLVAAKLSHSGEEGDDEDGTDSKGSKSSAARTAFARQRRFKTGDRTDNLYFGTPGLANIVHDFANLQVGNQSLTHTVPKPRELYTIEGSLYPFPVFAKWAGEGAATALIQLLPEREELFSILESFQRRAQSCSFPQTPDEVTRKEVERFLDDAESNGERYPDMLALIFATLATGLQMGQYDRSGNQWVAGSMAKTTKRADVYLAASMQALRMASYMNQPTMLGIQTLVMIGPYLTNSGRFLDAWTLFGTTIRLAHSIGLHRNPKFLDPAPPLRECMVRQTLWWWMLHMDQQYSVTLGRPLGISGFGDCPPPEPLTTNPTILRLSEFVNYFTILARQVLSSDGLMSPPKIDEFTDKFVGLWDTMPDALQFNESWLQADKPLPEWPLEVMSATMFAKVHSFLILLNRQRLDRAQGGPARTSPPGPMMQPSRSQPMMRSTSGGGQDHPIHAAPVRGHALVVKSSESILHTFIFFHRRNPAVLICWTMGQQAFNACMILILDEWETDNAHNHWLIEEAYAVFLELELNGVHKLAGLAVKRISDGIAQLGYRRAERERQAASSRRQAMQQPPALSIDTTTMMDWAGDSVMGNTGMFLLEDSGLQAFQPQAFRPLAWHMAGSANPSNPSNPPTPGIPSPIIPVSQVTAAPFPVMSPLFVPTTSIPVTNSPYSIGLQPRMPANMQHRRRQPQLSPQHQQQPQHQQLQQQQQQQQQMYMHQQQQQQQQQQDPTYQNFTPINPALHAHQLHHGQQQVRRGAGPRGVHKLDRPAVPSHSRQRRK